MAELLSKLRGLKKAVSITSVYSVVSSSDVTPGSLEVWVDLPDSIKYDPSLAPFKHLYEQHHGKSAVVLLLLLCLADRKWYMWLLTNMTQITINSKVKT